MKACFVPILELKRNAGVRGCRFLAVHSLLAALWMAAVTSVATASTGGLAGLTNPVVFVTQVPIPKENNGNVSNSFLSVVSLFGNQTSDMARAGRGGDLWLLYTNGNLLNLTHAAGYGVSGAQHTNGIAV